MSAAAREATEGNGKITVNAAAVTEIAEILVRHNPRASKNALTRALATVTSSSAFRLNPKERQTLLEQRELYAIVDKTVAKVAAQESPKPGHDSKSEAVSVGQELGLLIDIEEARRRLDAATILVRLEDWAGPVASPGEIETKLGTKRSTLYDWQKRGAVIGLLRGERKHVFPLAQFVDGRPVQGMADITKIIKNPRAAWQWLIAPKPSIGGSPLDLLKSGRLEDVIAAAQRDFA